MPEASQSIDQYLPDLTFDRLEGGVLLLTRAGRVLYANAPMVTLLGRPRDRVIGAHVDSILPVAESFLGRTCLASLGEMKRTATFGWDAFLGSWIGVRIFPTANGIEAHVRSMPTGNEEAAPPAEPAEEDTAVSLDSIAVPMSVLDREGVIQYANQADLDLLGYERDDYVGRPITDFLLYPATGRDLLDKLRRGEAMSDYEVALRHRSGEPRMVQITTGIHQDDTDIVYIQCFSRDITEQRAAEERDARLAAIVESSDDAIIAKRLDGIITSWNPGAERLYGYTAEEAIGERITLIMPAEMEDEFPSIMSRLARGEHIDHYETVRQAKNGRRIHVSVSIAPIRSSSGKIVGASTIARDISERRILELKQREFLSMVAHDLRSPLTAIKGYAQLMQRREAYSASAVTAILSQVLQMERLVGDVLDITRMDENQFEVDLAEVDLVQIVRTAVSRARDLEETDRVLLEVPNDPLVGMWDQARLAQILDNLLTNATKYAPTGDIAVRLTNQGSCAEIVVQDHGPGIAPEHLPYIFDRFYREPGSGSLARGVGLGLAITKALVEAHGGEISVDSTAGEGTAFTVRLPWDAAEMRSARTDTTTLQQ
ncbi:MAG TPA: PAS domain S-box protein [Thermomicrobiales bacterium]|nr:PAS domain S-box protein [Thermomicrobiales bacterium]